MARYRIVRPLGGGGAGVVYEAVLDGPGGYRKRVALKVLRDPGQDLEREARLGGLLRHRHLVDVYEVGRDGDVAYCAMELCPGGSLAARLPLPPRAVVEAGLQVCAALRYAHEELGLVHLDLKPANLLVSAGDVKVADLGIARADGFGGDGRIRGTPGYMPPEQARGGAVDARADVYALGITLAELATGVRPRVTSETVDSGTGEDAASTWSGDALAEPSADLVGVPGWLGEIVGRCVAVDPHDRWPDVASLAEALGRLEVAGPSLREALGAPVDPEPPSIVPCLGREAELAALVGDLATPGLLTLKGPAGVGKSALARALVEAWRSGGREARVAPVGEVGSTEGLLFAVADALGVPLGSGGLQAALDQLDHALAARGELLLVLDDADRMAPFAGHVERWLARADRVRVVATSREPLRVPGERVVEVGPLAPDGAVALLIATARERGVVLQDGPALRSLGAALDHLPLALELAAGRLGVLSVDEVAARLGLDLLRRGTTDRHATLRDALAWSWEQLPAPERSGLAQLAVFEGGARLDAIEAVVRKSGPTRDLLASLADRSLVRRAGDRWELLRSVRAFAAEQLDPAAREAAELRHAAHYAAWGAPATLATLELDAENARVARADLDNLLAAGERAVARGDGAVAVAALAATHWVMTIYQMGYSAGPLAARVAELPGLTPGERGRALHVLAMTLGIDNARHEPASELLDRALACAREAGDRHLELKIRLWRVTLVQVRGAYDVALRGLEELLADAVAQGDRGVESRVLAHLVDVRLHLGQLAAALADVERTVAVTRARGDRVLEATILLRRATIRMRLGEVAAAEADLEWALGRYRALGNRHMEVLVLLNLASIWVQRGQFEEARAQYAEIVETYRALGVVRSEAIARANLGSILQGMGRFEEARDQALAAGDAARRVGDGDLEGFTLGVLADVSLGLGDRVAAREARARSVALHRRAGSARLEAVALRHLGEVDLRSGDLDAARGSIGRAEAAFRSMGDRLELGLALCVRAELERAAGDLEAANRAVDEAEALLAAIGLPPASPLGRAVAAARVSPSPGA